MQDLVEKYLNEALEERTDLFLLELSISDDNSIKVVIDGDNGVLVEDCMYISRAIEHNMDREEHDFALEVLSAGATSPLKLLRQYAKHVGRNLQVTTGQGDSFEGQLQSVDDNSIVLTWKTREPKPVGKGKITITKEQEIGFSDIKEAKVKIKF